MIYEEEVIYDETHDEYLLPLPDKLLKDLGWEVGDTLSWCVKNNTIHLRKFDDKSLEEE